jgi:CRP-like cAMP-binding protein
LIQEEEGSGVPVFNPIPMCMIRVNEPRRLRWDLFVMTLATWNCLWIPLDIAFEPDASDSVFLIVVSNLIDFWFLIDIFLTFRTTYIKTSTGDEIVDPKKIAWHYIKTRFVIDVLSVFPFKIFMGYYDNLQFLDLFGILKVARVLRLGRIINIINAKEEIKTTLKLWNLVFLLILYIHLVGCTWYYIYNDEKDWIPPLDYMYVKTDLYDKSLYYQYLSAFYHSILMLNGNEVGPRNFIEYVFVCTALVVGAMLNANIFGNMAVLLQEMNKKSSKFREKMDTAKTAMRNMGIPTIMENKVINYLIYTQGNLDKQSEFKLMNKMISPSLRIEIVRWIFSKIINENPIFGCRNDLIDQVLLIISTVSFLPEQSIILQGNDANELYFLFQGECEVLVNDENSEKHRVNILTPGAMFGEIALISNCKRTATVKCLNYCTWATLTSSNIKELSRRFPEILGKLRAKRSEYNDWWKKYLKKLILSVEYFKKWKPATIEELMYSLREEFIEANKVIYKSGETIDNIKFISNGVIQLILRFDDGKEIVVDHLRQGSCLGLYSLLEPSPIMFQVKAKTNLKVQYLDYEILETFRKDHLELDRYLTEYEDYIDEFGLPICDYSIPYKVSVKTKFKNAVRRAISFNEYKHKKKSKLSKLIVELKKQKKEWEAKEDRKIKREEFKKELANLIYDKLKDIIANK